MAQSRYSEGHTSHADHHASLATTAVPFAAHIASHEALNQFRDGLFQLERHRHELKPVRERKNRGLQSMK